MKRQQAQQGLRADWLERRAPFLRLLMAIIAIGAVWGGIAFGDRVTLSGSAEGTGISAESLGSLSHEEWCDWYRERKEWLDSDRDPLAEFAEAYPE